MSLSSGLGLTDQRRGSGAGSALDPLSISGCIMWLDATDINTLWADSVGGIAIEDLDAQAVGAWEDKSTASNDATQASGSAQPLYRTNVQNGHPMLKWDGLNDYMRCDGIASTFSGNDKTATIFIIFKKTDNLTSQALISCGNSVLGGYFAAYTRNTPDYLITKQDDAATAVNAVPALPPDTSATLITLRLNGTTLDVDIDGLGVDVADPFNVGVTTLNGAALGAFYVTGAIIFPLSGYIGEVLIYNSALSGANRTLVNNYLIARWGL